MIKTDTIVALSTPTGPGAIGLIRVSGPDTFSIVQMIFKGKKIEDQTSHSLLFGRIVEADKIVDEVVLGIYKGPNSYTKEDIIEISCHGSPYIIKSIINLILKNGARMAEAGEYTMRAFINGQLDLAQAEAVADLIASQNEASHRIAMQQLRGGFSSRLKELRQELIDFAALVELELDFSEEDVEFANREKLTILIEHLQLEIGKLISSFSMGNAIKNGIPVVIAGKPNVGKSTLINALFSEEKALVSEIAGTTRDSIEDELIIQGVSFRFIDTAGLRETVDVIESMGVQKAYDKIKSSALLLFLFDPTQNTPKDLQNELEGLKKQYALTDSKLVLVANKSDAYPIIEIKDKYIEIENEIIFISAKEKKNLDQLLCVLLEKSEINKLSENDVVVSNLRHLDALNKAQDCLNSITENMSGSMLTEFLASDIRQALFHLGSITGQVTVEDILGSIFSRFCIGK